MPIACCGDLFSSPRWWWILITMIQEYASWQEPSIYSDGKPSICTGPQKIGRVMSAFYCCGSGFCCVAQVSIKFLDSSDCPASASWMLLFHIQDMPLCLAGCCSVWELRSLKRMHSWKEGHSLFSYRKQRRTQRQSQIFLKEWFLINSRRKLWVTNIFTWEEN